MDLYNNNGIAYATQTAWIYNASLRDNILFGKPYEKTRYFQVLDACALQPDINILPAGDLTEIGEKGINLSGGQKQRVSVARALYSDKNIVLLDDPLSALDVHVGEHLFQKAIVEFLLKNKKTVLFVTHQLQYLKQADKVLMMQDGSIIHNGTFDVISASDPNLFSDWKQYTKEENISVTESSVERKIVQTQVKCVSKEEMRDGKLMEAEELKRGAVSFSVYKYLILTMGCPILLAIFITRFAEQTVNFGSLFWLARWSSVEEPIHGTSNITKVNNEFFVTGYVLFALGSCVSTFILCILLVTAFYYAAKQIHLDMVRNIFGSNLRFFETTPIGRIVNRLSTDTDTLDTKLLMSFALSVYFVVYLPASIIAIGVIQPIFLLEITPIVFIFILLKHYYIVTARELQRLNNITNSPVFSHFSETLGGLPTIRAYKAQDRLFRELLQRIDINNTAQLYLSAASNGWICSRLSFLTLITLTMASVTAVTLGLSSKISASEIGLVLSLASTIPYTIWAVIKHATDIEIQMNAVERIKYYTELPNEPTEGIEPPENWPHLGEIRIEDLSVRYASDLPFILKSINLLIKPGEKVGVCGRTGSGKSSLTLSLFRVIESTQGKIFIDGEDIHTLPVDTLRSRLSIIPQDPVLFNGSIRLNIDPEEERTDEELWEALEKAQLKYVVSKLEGGLDFEVSVGGENFSQGQRQLFCLVRAFLRNSRILIMDEATASIDYETERILQEAVKLHFQDKTVITIAHRISTIMKSDTIVVLRDGEIVEHDTPKNLLTNEDSIFASFVQTSK